MPQNLDDHVPLYTSGRYFSDPRRHAEDAEFKSAGFLRIFPRFAARHGVRVNSYADVGCGSGDVVRLVADGLRRQGHELQRVQGYDVSPHVEGLCDEGIEYVRANFGDTRELVDLVTLFDVIEHVPDPVEFIRAAARLSKIMVFHVPLDNSLNNAVRNKFRRKLLDPGHLIFLDAASALNLLARAGLRVMDYEYTFSFLAPSGHTSILSKIAFPLRYLLSRLSPWLLSRTAGGASLMVVAVTSNGWGEILREDGQPQS